MVQRRILTQERQYELVKDYLAGVYRTELSKKYDLFPTQIYAYLRKNGVQANRQRKPKLEYHCVVCGCLRPMPPYSPNTIWRLTQTCDDEACKSILLMRPDLRARAPMSAPRVAGAPSHTHKRLWEDLQELDAQQEIASLDATELATLERAFHLGADERGADITESARRSLWGALSDVSVAVHLRAEGPAETAITLSKKNPLGAFLKRFFGGCSDAMADTADSFDVVYLWRCGCPRQQSYVIRSLTDLPSTPGEYGVCTLCSAAALVIE